MSIPQLIEKAINYHQSGHLHEAENLYKSVLQQQPENPDALHLFGVIAHQIGKNEIAVNLIDSVINLNPIVPTFYNNCGEAYRALQNNDLAITRFEQALAIQPDYAEAHNNLGIVFKDLGRGECPSPAQPWCYEPRRIRCTTGLCSGVCMGRYCCCKWSRKRNSNA